MAFDWKEYLDLAWFLQGSGESYAREAAWRSAESRAYYAAFCYARNYARDQHGFRPTYGPDDHTRVREHFKQKGMVSIFQHLKSLRKWRNDCDYKDTVFLEPRLVMSAVRQAEQVFKKLK